MIPQRKFPPRPKLTHDDDGGCVIEIKKTKSGGKRIKIGKNCTKDQIRMLRESGEIKSEDLGD